MAAPMTDEMVVKAIGKEFQQEYEEIKRTRLQSWEQVFAASWCSTLATRERSSRFKQDWLGSEWTEDFGFCLVTTHRLLTCMYRAGSNRGRLYHGTYDYLTGSDRYHRQSLITDGSPLTEEELASRDFRERSLGDLKVTAEDRVFAKNGKQYKIMLLQNLFTNFAGFGGTAFAYEGGQSLYAALQLAMANGGRMPLEAPAERKSDDAISALERLTALWKADGLSDEEFRIAKRKLLGM